MNGNPMQPAQSKPEPEQPSSSAPRRLPDDARIPREKRERFGEVAQLLEQFSQAHLDCGMTLLRFSLQTGCLSRWGWPNKWAWCRPMPCPADINRLTIPLAATKFPP